MGWVWKDDDDDRKSGKISEFKYLNPRSEAGCSTRKIISSQCRTEEVEPGKFIRKYEKTDQLLRNSFGRNGYRIPTPKSFIKDPIPPKTKRIDIDNMGHKRPCTNGTKLSIQVLPVTLDAWSDDEIDAMIEVG
ncbi:hypothetical protein L2E82_47635 [Cichorium intybus]|nr:hypothetical protein L2E82_47635 [Cichorium intybus]